MTTSTIKGSPATHKPTETQSMSNLRNALHAIDRIADQESNQTLKEQTAKALEAFEQLDK